MAVIVSPGLEIRPFDPADLGSVRKLYAEVWGSGRDRRHDELRWLGADGAGAVGIVATHGEECIGFVSIWPATLRAGDRSVAGGQPIDVMTSPRWQGKGLFTRMASEAVRLASRRGMGLLFGAPNAAALPGWRHRLGWAEPGTIVTWTRPLALVGVVPSARGLDALLAVAGIRRDGTDLRMGEGQPTDRDLDGLLSSLDPPRSWHVARTLRWYGHRYLSTATVSYRWLCLYEGIRLRALAVLGLPSAGGRLRRANLAHVVASSQRHRRSVISTAARLAAGTGHRVLVAKSTGDGARDLMRCGFVPVSRAPLIVRTLDAESLEPNPFCARSWSLFGADFDSF